MDHKIKVLARMVLGFAVIAIAIIAALYVLEVLTGADAKDMAVKTILILAIIGVAATGLLALGGREGTPPLA